MMSFNKLKRSALAGGILVGTPLAALGVFNLVNGAEGDPANRTEEQKQGLAAAIIREMDPRFLEQNHPFNSGLFETTTTWGPILTQRSDARWSEAQKRVTGPDGALTKSYIAAGAEPGNTQYDPDTAAHIRGNLGCAAWLINTQADNPPGTLQGETLAAFRSGKFATVESRCAGALVARVVRGLHEIQAVTNTAG